MRRVESIADDGNAVSDIDDFDHYRYVASLIERYLRSHPESMDNLEGIQQWWITRQKLKESEETVARAIELLLEKGVITRDERGRYRYSVH